MTLPTIKRPIWAGKETYQKHVDAMVANMWTMFEELQKPIPIGVLDDEPQLTFAEECAQMTPDELDDAYLDGWQKNVPDEVFDALFARRARQIRQKIDQLDAQMRDLSASWAKLKQIPPDEAERMEALCSEICELEDQLGWTR